MNVSLLTIGNEILSGDTINSNVAWIGRSLSELGCSIQSQMTVPDEEKPIVRALNQLLDDGPAFIIITGGLGPTTDDITREVLFKFFGTSSEFDEDYWDKMKKRFEKYDMDIPESNRNQALIPTNGHIIPNPVGSARGFLFRKENIAIISLPGVPSEMKVMMNDSIIPMIKEEGITPIFNRTLRTVGIPESALIEKIGPALDTNLGCNLGYYPSIFGVDIKISHFDAQPVENLSNDIYQILGVSIYGDGKETLEEIIVQLGLTKNKTVSTAESCTGGLIGHRLTEISGSSSIFKGGIVVYSNESKMSLLGIKKDLLESQGAVSYETAEQMAINVKNKFNTDYGISVTGIAGPTGGSDKKTVGLVYIGMAKNKGVKVKEFHFGTNRKRNKLRSSQAALNWLRLSLLND
jgi:nicotinamide-nucleotide amidase